MVRATHILGICRVKILVISQVMKVQLLYSPWYLLLFPFSSIICLCLNKYSILSEQLPQCFQRMGSFPLFSMSCVTEVPSLPQAAAGRSDHWTHRSVLCRSFLTVWPWSVREGEQLPWASVTAFPCLFDVSILHWYMLGVLVSPSWILEHSKR